jgi:Domain of unknown function (DUF4430)
MKRKDWLILLGTMIFIAGCLFGITEYRAWQTTQPAAPVTQVEPTEESESEQASATIRITKDFGHETVLFAQVPVKEGDTVMDILNNSGTTITTSYNGGFVESIAGIASQYQVGDATSKKVDWFYYVNGLMAEVGAAEYPVFPGDQIWWDYHTWETEIQSPALIGNYPHPFVKGLGEEPAPEITVMYTAGYQQQAENIVSSLKDIRPAIKEPVSWDEQQFSKESALILVGDTQSLRKSQQVTAIFDHRDIHGLYAHIEAAAIQTYDQAGQPAEVYNQPGTGLLVSTLNMQNRLPIWIVTGIDEAGLEQAIRRMSPADSQQIEGFFGAILTDEEIIRLPIIK